ncbi:MAG: DUF2249 domain-containing protein [Thermomicrobiales bacterium]
MSHTDQDPILASWRISEVLQRYPALLDTLIDLSPTFGKLRNPLTRKVQSRLVTVEQAAGIAGLDPRQLVRTLNQQAGITTVPANDPATGTPAPHESAPSWFGTTTVARELDVRPMLDRGEEPFTIISAAARAIPVGQVLRLLVTFEPLPLYDALAKQGFDHFGEQRDGTWHVEFLRTRTVGSPAPSPTPAQPAAPIDWDRPATSSVTIDVSELVPPEPMVKILSTLETLPAGARLLVHHVRRPIHLYDRLDEMGYPHATRELGPDRVEVMIEKPATVPAAHGAQP